MVYELWAKNSAGTDSDSQLRSARPHGVELGPANRTAPFLRDRHGSVQPSLKAVAAISALAALVGCQSLLDGAKETFSNENTCPIERVEARERPELKASSFKAKRTPPADIAADPGRLAMWQKQEEASHTSSDGLGSIAEVRGCGKRAFYRCYRSSKQAHRMHCVSERDETGTISKW
jgi:hypothetical protein